MPLRCPSRGSSSWFAGRIAGALLAFSCWALTPACAVEALDEQAFDAEPIDTEGLAVGVGCDTKLVNFQLAGSSHQVHEVRSDYTWHKVNPCLEQLQGAAGKDGPASASADLLYQQTLYLLSNPNVRFYKQGKTDYLKLNHVVNGKEKLDLSKFNRLVYWNEKHIAYDSMSQVDFGLRMLRIYRLFLKQEGKLSERGRVFRELGLAALGVITDPIADGGLRSRSECAHWKGKACAWFHSVTRRDFDETNAGATLNKSLHPVRDMYEAAQVLAEVDALDTTTSHSSRIDALRQASFEGTYQLVYGKGSDGKGSAPNLFDFIATTPGGKPIQRSWLYYGFNPELGKAHFLGNKGNDWKNCGYHMHVMQLLSAILPRLPQSERAGFTKVRASLGVSVVDFIVSAYQVKAGEGLGGDSKTQTNGAFGSCGEKAKTPLSPAVISALSGL